MSTAPGPDLPSGDVTFLLTDVEGSTDLLKRLGDQEYAEVIAAARDLLRAQAESQGGRLVGTDGDACFLAFPTAAGALSTCAAVQRELLRPWRDGTVVRVRMGLHRGRDIRPTEDNYATLAVHRAARVSAAAHGGQVLLTPEVAEAAPDQCAPLGFFELRDFDEPVPLYALRWAGDGTGLQLPRALPTGSESFPTYRTTFVGRDEETAAVRARIRNQRLVTLVGPGGSGKTRLAVESLRNAGVFAASWFVDLTAARSATDVVDAVRRALGSTAASLPAEDDPVQAVVKVLGSHKAILVFDNCEQALDAIADYVDGVLGCCDTIHVLCTSREPLALPDERLVRVLGLALPTGTGDLMSSPAAQLFVERADQVTDLSWDVRTAAIVGELVRALDGLPLALELVAAMTWEHPLEQVLSAVRSQLGQGDDDTGRVTRGRPQRHVSLRSVIAWSVQDLEPAARRALAALALATSPIAPRTVAAALAPVGAAPGVVDLLVRRSLLQRDSTDGTVRFFETIRAYALGLADLGADRGAVLAALVADCLAGLGTPRGINHYSALVDAAVTPTASALLDSDEVPVRDRQRLAWALAPTVQRVGPKRVDVLLRQALALGNDDPELVAHLHQGLAFNAATVRDREASTHHLALSASLLPEAGAVVHDHWLAQAYVELRQGDFQEALDIATTYADAEDSGWRLLWLPLLGICRSFMGDLEGAESVFAELAEVAEGSARTAALHNLANTQLLRGDVTSALRNSEVVLRTADSPRFQAMSVDVVAQSLAAERFTVEAFALLVWSAAYLDELGWTSFDPEAEEWARNEARALSELTPEEVSAARDRAASLDATAARDLALSLAAAHLDTAQRQAAVGA